MRRNEGKGRDRRSEGIIPNVLNKVVGIFIILNVQCKYVNFSCYFQKNGIY